MDSAHLALLGAAAAAGGAVNAIAGGGSLITFPALLACNMPAVIANEFGEATGVFRAALMGLGVLLFIFTIVINVIARGVVERSARRQRGA